MQQNMQPRAPPSPSPSQAGSQYNGNGAQQNGIPMVNGLPSGGQQTDMNHLWAIVQQLSQVLEDNKAQTIGIVNGVNAVRARAAEESGGTVNGNGSFRQVNGELDGRPHPPYHPCYGIQKLTKYHSSNPRRRDLKSPIPTHLHAKPPPDPHVVKHISPIPPHRLRERTHPLARQVATVCIQPNLVDTHAAQALSAPARGGARRKHAVEARACGVAGWAGAGGGLCAHSAEDARGERGGTEEGD